MNPARLLTVVGAALAATAVCWVALSTWTGSGHEAPPLPWTAVAGTAALAIVVLSAGLPVRQWVRGDRSLDPLVAARTAVLAKAAAYGGALLTGWYAAQAILVLPDIVGARRTRLTLAIAAAVAAVTVAAAGMIVQNWCRVPPPPDDDDPRDD